MQFKLEPMFLATFLFAAGLFSGCALGYYVIRHVDTPVLGDPHLHRRVIHATPVNRVFSPLIDEDYPPGRAPSP